MYCTAVGFIVGQDGQDDVGNTDDDDDDGDGDDDVDGDGDVDVNGKAKPEEMCLAGQLASLLYSSAKTASSSLLLEQDKPKTLPLPEIQKRRQNLRVSCILSFFLLQGILCAFRSRT